MHTPNTQQKATSWVAEWQERRRLRAMDKERAARKEALAERGEWGYIPPGCDIISKSILRNIRWCLVVILLSNTVILAGQWKLYFSHEAATGTAAMTAPAAAIAPNQ